MNRHDTKEVYNYLIENNIDEENIKLLKKEEPMTINKMTLIMDIIENKFNLDTNIKGNANIYAFICALDRYSIEELKKIEKFIDEYKDIFSMESILDIIKFNKTWSK